MTTTTIHPGDPDPLHPQLGPLREELRAVAWRPWVFNGGCFLTALACVAGVLLMPLAPLAVEEGETAQGRAELAVGLWVVAGVCVAVTALMVRRTLRQRRLRLRLHDRGLFFHDGWRRTQVWLWDGIASFQAEVTRVSAHGIPVGTQHRYTLRGEAGETLRLNHEVRDVARAAEQIARETRARLLPRAFATVEAGGTVPFGAWTVTREDVTRGPGRRLPWAEVRDIALDGYGAIVIRQRSQRFGAWARLAYGKLPNAHVFLPLAENLRKRAASDYLDGVLP